MMIKMGTETLKYGVLEFIDISRKETMISARRDLWKILIFERKAL